MDAVQEVVESKFGPYHGKAGRADEGVGARERPRW